MRTDPTDPLELLTLSQVGQLLKRSRHSLTRDIKEGRLHAVHLGGSVRLPRTEVERYVYGGEDQFPTRQEPV